MVVKPVDGLPKKVLISPEAIQKLDYDSKHYL
jgi:hypothetical protein